MPGATQDPPDPARAARRSNGRGATASPTGGRAARPTKAGRPAKTPPAAAKPTFLETLRTSRTRQVDEWFEAIGWTTAAQIETNLRGTGLLQDNVKSNQAQVNQWRRSRFAPPALGEVLAAVDPTHADRLVSWDRLSALIKLVSDGADSSPDRAGRIGLHLALLLDGGLDDKPRSVNVKEPIDHQGEDALWCRAISLLTDVADQARRAGTHPLVLLDVPGMETSTFASGRQSAADGWSSALKNALQAGVRVVHVVGRSSDRAQPLPEQVQAELTVHLLYAAAVGGSYQPILDSPVAPRNAMAAEGVGTISVWWSGPGSDRVFHELHPHGTSGLGGLTAFLLEGVGSLRRSRAAAPRLVLHGESDAYEALRFDMALAAAESDAQAEHCMIKAGLPVALMPHEVSSKQRDHWAAAADDELLPLIDVHLVARQARADAVEVTLETGRFRDIVTLEGIVEYLSPTAATPPRGGAQWGPEHLLPEERIAHARATAAAVRRGHRLAIVPDVGLPFPVNDTWWSAARGAAADSSAVFFVAKRGSGTEREQHQGWLTDSSRTSIVDSFFALFDLLWEALPSVSGVTEPEEVARLLESLAADAEADLRPA